MTTIKKYIDIELIKLVYKNEGLDGLKSLFTICDTFIFMDFESDLIYTLFNNKEFCKVKSLIRFDN